MIRPKLFFALGPAFALIMSLGCGGAPQRTPEYEVPSFNVPTAGLPATGTERLDSNVSAVLKKWNVPGIAVAIAKDGKLIVAKGYGYSDIESGRPMAADAMFRIGSTTKMMTAAAVLQLIEQGRLSLDAKFLDLLPEYAVPGSDSRLNLITVRMLLQHSGGWDRSVSGDPFNKQVEIARELNVPSPAGCSDTIRYMMRKPLDFQPGTKWAYSNLGYCILGRIIEKISGESYDTYVRTHVLQTAGALGPYIGITQQGHQGPLEVKYYDYSGAPLAQSVFPGEGKVPLQYGGLELQDACGGWISSTVDLLRFISVLDGSRSPALLNSNTMSQMLANPGLSGIGPSQWYGFGVFVTPSDWCHGGSFPGAQAQLCHISNGYSFAVMSNSRTKDPDDFAPEMEAAVRDALGSESVDSTVDLFQRFPSQNPPAH